jgi:hypothetical protein
MVRSVLVFAIACSSSGPPPNNPGSGHGSGTGSSARILAEVEDMMAVTGSTATVASERLLLTN